MALAAMPRRRTVPARRLRIRFGHHDAGAVMRLLDASGVARRGEDWAVVPELDVAVPVGEWDLLIRRLRDGTAGRAEVLSTDLWELLDAPMPAEK